jgi:hypothetical protein
MSGRYEIKQGHFLIVTTGSGDLYEDLTHELDNNLYTDDELKERAIRLRDSSHGLRGCEWFAHKGFIIVDSHDSHRCMDTLADTEVEAIAALAEYNESI